jgi:hypothetical protein
VRPYPRPSSQRDRKRQAGHLTVRPAIRQGDGASEWSAAGGEYTGYANLGVEHGIAVARANQLPGASNSARPIAEHLVAEIVRTGVAPRVRVEAAVLAAWALLGAETGRSSDTSER